MKTLLSKKCMIAFAAIVFCITSINAQTANPQLKIKEYKLKQNLLLHLKQKHSAVNSHQNFGIKINPYWQDVNAPHIYTTVIYLK